MKKDIYLICNAHLDPVWQWEWPVGLAEALSTFRIAADFCEKFDGFVFNHNEALLYMWIEEYAPELFKKIQELVKAGKWHIMGGWYLQPDCNMPSGESISRQIRVGREYFKEKFGCTPNVAMNVDPFGHDRGLVQILSKNGYIGYLISRSGKHKEGDLPNEFLWKGYNGYELIVHTAYNGYNSLMGKSVQKFESILSEHQDQDKIMILWGVGNHGGGPSRQDLKAISKWSEENKDRYNVIHSTPEEYFATVNKQELSQFDKDLTPIMVGCYTSQRRIKQLHSELENTLLQTEKVCCAANTQIGFDIPYEALKSAEKHLLFNEFHDILPGSMIAEAEESAIKEMGGAIESLKQIRTKAFIKIASKFPAPPENTMPIFVYNPHPYRISAVTFVDFMLPDQNWDKTWTDYDFFDGENKLISQQIKEKSNVPLDWSKQFAFELEILPFEMKQIIAKPHLLPQKPSIAKDDSEFFVMKCDKSTVTISKETGLISSYICNGKSILKKDAGKLCVIKDNEDPWGMLVSEFKEKTGEFRLASAEEATAIAGLNCELKPVNIIEDGQVFTTVQSIFVYRKSQAVVNYTLEHKTGKLSVDINLDFVESNRMVKWELPVDFENSNCIGQGMFGHHDLFDDGRENVSQRWLAVANKNEALTIANNSGVYASSFENGTVYETLVRTPVHCAHPVEERQIIPTDRALPHIDSGNHKYHFVLNAGKTDMRIGAIERESQILCEPLITLSAFTDGNQNANIPAFIECDNDFVTLTSCRPFEGGMTIRVFNQSEVSQDTQIKIHKTGKCFKLSLNPIDYEDIEIKF